MPKAEKPKDLAKIFKESGARGGAAGTGKAKARTTEQARAAARARWGKKTAAPLVVGLAKIANGKTAKMTKAEYAAVDLLAIHGMKFKTVKIKAPKRASKRKVSPTFDFSYSSMVPNCTSFSIGG